MGKLAKHANTTRRSTAAYTLLDLSDLDDDDRKAIIEDANAGGGAYGIRVVEHSVNGGATAPIYGVYKTGPDADRWAETKKKFNLGSTEVDDSTVIAGVGVEVDDPRREAALREAAAQTAEAEADRIRAGEAEAVRTITGNEDDDANRDRTVGRPTGGDHPQNIVDPELAPDAENEAATAENQAPAKASKSKTPR
jgi:hypothetical protein